MDRCFPGGALGASNSIFLRYDLPVCALDRYARGEFMESPPAVYGNFLIWLAVYPRGSWNALEGFISAYLCFWPIDEEQAGDWAISCPPICIRAVCEDPYVFQEWNTINRRICKQRYYCGCSELLEVEDCMPGTVFSFQAEIEELPSLGKSCSYLRLWQQRVFTDTVVALGDDGPEVPCHRAVLAASSAVFERMLQSDMREGTERRVVLRGVNAKAAHSFIEFIYTGELPKDIGNVQHLADLMCLADQYGLRHLMTLSAALLASMISPENIAEVLKELRRYQTNPNVKRILDQQVRSLRVNDELLAALVQNF